jgi:Pol polyprotein, beta-barrel domain/GAG-pre-integrase domain
MTPHHHWFVSYAPCQVPIHLANDEVIRVAGVGTVEFRPMKDGHPLQPVAFSHVLHVPSIANNLLSVLSLTQNHGFTVTIHQNQMDFKCSTTLHFSASINENNVAYLEGKTVSHESAHLAHSPLTLDLWYHCLGHIGQDHLQELVTKDLVTGLKLDSSKSPAPICEPCVLGTQHREPFPRSVSSHHSKPLELVHSDLHGPTPVCTSSGYRYWVTFIDDATHYYFVYLLKTKDVCCIQAIQGPC